MQRVLMIDDDRQVASVLAMALEALGHEVVVSSETEQTETLLLEVKPTFILLDMMMPGRSGIELLEPVREYSPDAVVCMMTGLVDPELLKNAMQAGAWNILYKPYSLTELNELLTMTELLADALRLEKALQSEHETEVRVCYSGSESFKAEDIARMVHFADQHDHERDLVHRRLPIVAGELLQNAKLHGAKNDSGKTYSAILGVDAGSLTLKVTDSGDPFNWHKALALQSAPAAGGGAPGLQLVKHLVKRVSQAEDGKTICAVL